MKMGKMEAEFVRDVNPEARGDQKLWRYGKLYVVTSVIPQAPDTGKPETFVFASDESGAITRWGELTGSLYDEMDHDKAIKGFVEYVESLTAKDKAKDE
jgi:hypothetical protein